MKLFFIEFYLSFFNSAVCIIKTIKYKNHSFWIHLSPNSNFVPMQYIYVVVLIITYNRLYEVSQTRQPKKCDSLHIDTVY